MVFVFTSDDAGYAEMKARERIRKDHPDLDRSLDFARFDGTQDALTSVVEEALSLSFTGNRKQILLVNPTFLDEKKKRGGQSDKDIQSFIGYLNSPNPDTDLYVCREGALGRTPAGKALKAAADATDCPFPTGEDLVLFTMRLISDSGATCDRSTAQMIAERAGTGWWTLKNAVERLCLFTDRIRPSDVDQLVPRKLEDRIYTITENLLSGRPSEAVKSYRDLRRTRDALSILPFLFSDFRVDAQVNYLAGKRMSDSAIGEELGIKPYRARMVRQKTAGRLSYKICIKVLADLGRMEKNIKFDLDDPDIRIEEFLLNFSRRYIRRR